MQMNAIGLIELYSIAAGIDLTDTMLDTADVELVLSRTICSGKYLVVVGGSVAAVEAAVNAGIDQAQGLVIDSLTVPNIDDQIFPAIAGANDVAELGALGVLEAFSVGSLIEGADAAVKAADVKLLEVRLAMALGGKAYCTITGDVSSVNEAVEVGASKIADKGLLVNKVVIAAPNKQLYRDYI